MSAFWLRLLRAELFLTFNILLGVLLGELILSPWVTKRVFAPLVNTARRTGIGPLPASAMLISLGSARTGAALLAAGFRRGELGRQETIFATLTLAFPAYLRRWMGTVTVATGMAGTAGLLYATILLFRSMAGFIWMTLLLRRESSSTGAVEEKTEIPQEGWPLRLKRIRRMLSHSLPMAWAFLGGMYILAPHIERGIRHSSFWGRLFDSTMWNVFGGPPSGDAFAVAISSCFHSTAGLTAAGAALSRGSLEVGGALLALLVGHMAGTLMRTLRQNVAYWIGIFPRELVLTLLGWRLSTLLFFDVVSILLVGMVIHYI